MEKIKNLENKPRCLPSGYTNVLINSQPKYKTYLWITWGVIAAFIFYVSFQNIFFSEKGRVRKLIFEGKRAAETRNILACAEMISMSYRDKYGNDRSTVIYAAKEVFAYYKNIFIQIEKMDIKLDEPGNQAEVEIVALVLCQSKENKNERIFEGDKGRFRVRLVKEDNRWKVGEVEFLERVTIMGQTIA